MVAAKWRRDLVRVANHEPTLTDFPVGHPQLAGDDKNALTRGDHPFARIVISGLKADKQRLCARSLVLAQDFDTHASKVNGGRIIAANEGSSRYPRKE